MQPEAGSFRATIKTGIVDIAWDEQGFLTSVRPNPSGGSVLSATWIPARAYRFLEDLREYFERGAPFSRTSCSDIAVDQWTDFQRKVYEATCSIPHGETRTYGWVATKIGTPLACRAVGQALRKNPVPLLVPCHRVISNQSLGGFMGEDGPESPELDLKRQLLSLENNFVNPTFWCA